MVKINPNNNFVFKSKMPNQDYIEKEEKNKKTKTYVPKAPSVEEINEADTPL